MRREIIEWDKAQNSGNRTERPTGVAFHNAAKFRVGFGGFGSCNAGNSI
jgi:hypothetical protein